jgi:hypothetical protein
VAAEAPASAVMSLSCPVCRQTGVFVHDEGIEAKAAQAQCDVVCPYGGCGQVVARRMLDAHIYSCPARRQYGDWGDGDAAEDLKHATAAAGGAGQQHHDSVARDESSDDAPVMVHYVREADTLPGLAIRYGCAVQDIRRLNQLHGDFIHGFVSLLVPRPVGYNPDENRPDPAVLEALRKRKAIRQFRSAIQGGCDVCEAVAYLNLCGCVGCDCVCVMVCVCDGV